ncbi:small ribosomal subunit protein bS18m isoform X1 [Nothobranchius furzeri]|uniref:Small ribosomal subunit protein bS18m n=1 Tax=Nothobranchius furzeri TaxID=105023 RepID=A0A1A8U3B2_NOTFU|nr:28S ribosomal protein S18c, mitochondrial isoform X1 [Nothobranchius furzeri]KAF7216727.1 transcript variant X1 [Nothobranchius furzeri]
MLCVRRLRSLKTALYVSVNPGSRSLTSEVDLHKDHMIIQMENPYKEPQKGCTLCNVTVDFKNIQLLSQFVSPHTGRIYGRHITGLCGIKQKEVSKAIKKAHSLGFMSVTHKHPQFMKDPNICGIKHLD